MGRGPPANSEETEVIAALRRGQEAVVCHVLPVLGCLAEEEQISAALATASLISIKGGPVDRCQRAISGPRQPYGCGAQRPIGKEDGAEVRLRNR